MLFLSFHCLSSKFFVVFTLKNMQGYLSIDKFLTLRLETYGINQIQEFNKLILVKGTPISTHSCKTWTFRITNVINERAIPRHLIFKKNDKFVIFFLLYFIYKWFQLLLQCFIFWVQFSFKKIFMFICFTELCRSPTSRVISTILCCLVLLIIIDKLIVLIWNKE